MNNAKCVFSESEIDGTEDLLFIRAFGNSAKATGYDGAKSKALTLNIPFVNVGVVDISNRTVPDYVDRNADKQCILMKSIFENSGADGNCLAFYEYYDEETQNNAQKKIEFFYSFMEDKFKDTRPFVYVVEQNEKYNTDTSDNLSIALKSKYLVIESGVDGVPGSDYGAVKYFDVDGNVVTSAWSDAMINEILSIKDTDKEIGESTETNDDDTPDEETPSATNYDFTNIEAYLKYLAKFFGYAK